MSKLVSIACASFFALIMTTSYADVFTPQEVSLQSNTLPTNPEAVPASPVTPTPSLLQNNTTAPKKPIVAKKAVNPFTGKIKGNKVRVRLNPDMDGKIVKEMKKNEFVAVVDEEGDFWVISAPEGIKAYVFRSFVLDNIVEGNRVNVRIEPSLEAPIIGHLNSGDKVKGSISSQNNKWLEIAPPSGVRFYIAKEFVEFVGGPELKAQMDKRKTAVDQLLDSATLLSKSEMRKAFEEIDFDRLKHSYQVIIHDYTDFPEQVQHAQEALSSLQEAYLEKRITYLETKAAASAHQEELAAMENEKQVPNDRMKMWQPIEEALYLTWAHLNEEKTLDDYYDQEKLIAVALSGIVESYGTPVKNKPGDFVLKENDLPVAYIYSTKVNLQNYIGKKVTVIGSPRPNNHFAFPAFYVHEIE